MGDGSDTSVHSGVDETRPLSRPCDKFDKEYGCNQCCDENKAR